jgi:hypothetical protein
MATAPKPFWLMFVAWLDHAVQRLPELILLALSPPYYLDESIEDLLDEPYGYMLWMSDW